MRVLMLPAVAALTLSAQRAAAQGPDSSATTALATAALATPAPVTLRDFAGSLGVGVPRGRLVRTSTTPVAALLQRIESLRQRASVDATVPPDGAAVPSCPMPVVRIDTTALAPMPVVAPTGDLPVAGQLKGCHNPLR
jgi:hypothetical protein